MALDPEGRKIPIPRVDTMLANNLRLCTDVLYIPKMNLDENYPRRQAIPVPTHAVVIFRSKV